MKQLQLEELHRLRASLETVEKRVYDAEQSIGRIMEEVREARLSITLLLESVRTAQEFGAETEGQHWVVGGLPT